MLAPEDIELAGSALGYIPPPGEPLLGSELAPGDEIVLVPSSGLHANGASLARLVASRLPAGYATPLASGSTLGEALLEPSLMYVALVERLLAAGMAPTYISHVTGHGLLKLMRARRELTYRVRALPAVPEVLAFIAAQAALDDRAAYQTLNMGTGLALYCAAGHGRDAVGVATGMGLAAVLAGQVEEGPRRVILEPLGVTYEGSELELTPR